MSDLVPQGVGPSVGWCMANARVQEQTDRIRLALALLEVIEDDRTLIDIYALWDVDPANRQPFIHFFRRWILRLAREKVEEKGR